MTLTNTALQSPSSGNHLLKNDNSNPQQGTGLTPSVMESTSPTAPTKSANDGANFRTNPMRSPPNKKDSRKLFVGGLPADITDDEFRVFFEGFGEVVDSVVMFDRETHRSRGFGFVTFHSSEVADRLLTMGQGEDENGAGKPEDSTNAPRVGRLVMRGKTCEVKAAEPKEASRSSRRGYQNQGGSGPNRRFVDKAYDHANPPGAPHATSHQHDAHYLAGHHYPMSNPYFYPAYHPGMYHGEVGYHPGPVYAPVTNTATVQMHNLNNGINQPLVPPVMAVPMDSAPYMETPYETGHAFVPAAYAHPEMMGQFYAHLHHQPPKTSHGQHGTYPTPGTPASVMQPAAPGLPTKDE